MTGTLVSEDALGDPRHLPLQRHVMAALSFGAGLVHFVMVPAHWELSWVAGVFFIATGWFQIATGWLLATRPSLRLMRVSMLGNALVLAVWLGSWALAWPFRHVEIVGFLDFTAAGYEFALVTLSAVTLLRVSSSRTRRLAGTPIAPRLVSLCVALLTTVAIASPSAREHAATSHGQEAAHIAHGAGAGVSDDRGLSLLNNGHGHSAAQPMPAAVDGSERAALSHQIALTHQVAQIESPWV